MANGNAAETAATESRSAGGALEPASLDAPARSLVVLSARHVSYRVGDKLLLDDVSLDLRAGSVHALIGPNGAGKSTLLKVLAGDVRPTAGELTLLGRPLRSYGKRELALLRAVMPQDAVLSLPFTAEEVVAMGRYPHRGRRGAGGRQQPAARNHETVIRESMQATESAHLRERLYPTLSGGEQARVTLARVLAQETPLVFLDEPTASLDPRHQHLVMRLARDVARKGGTVLAVLHDMNLASLYADDVVLMSGGRVRAHGSPAEVLRRELLEEVFQARFHVAQHPLLPRPLVLSLPHDA